MSAWDDLGPEQIAIMITAFEEAYLINVMDEWRARQRWAETQSTHVPSDLTDLDKEQLIGHFASVVSDLVIRGWLDIEEHSLPLTDSALHAALNDPDSWISTPDSEHRMVMLMTTTAWDEVVRQPVDPEA